jgi:glycosyltransferase involved in cell wall biosynthesis
MEALDSEAGPDSPRLRIVGTTINDSDARYERALRESMWRRQLQGRVIFEGFVPSEYLPLAHRGAVLHLNVSQTGSLDKAVLESLACGCPVLTGNEAFHDLLREYPEFVITDDRPQAIRDRVLWLKARRGEYSPEKLRGLVQGRHDLASYTDRILANLQEVSQMGRRRRN